jgi:LmbE family N-acetylglucosaminyl deacetylase
MKRKEFLMRGLVTGTGTISGTSMFDSGFASNQSFPAKKAGNGTFKVPAGDPEEIVFERPVPGKPHKGKVLLAIQAHSDDIPLFAGGLVSKLLDEGYTGYLLRTSDDSSGDYKGNLVDNQKIAEYWGMKKAYDFFYKHHEMDAIQIQDLKARLIFLFRLLKVDTVISWDPWEHYEENPDHVVTARAVEAARWMAQMETDYPEHLDAGLVPYGPAERYYYSRDTKRVNRIVDISNYIDQKVEVNMLNVTKGPAGKGFGKKLRDQLASEGKALPILGDSGKSADFNFVKHVVFGIDSRRLYVYFPTISNKELGEQYGVEWAERYHYINDNIPDRLEQYIKDHAEPL